MAYGRVISVVTLLSAVLASAVPMLRAADPAREIHIEATIPRSGGFMDVGFGSIWMMNVNKLVRIRLADNAITDIPLAGVTGMIDGAMPPGLKMAVGEGAVWVPHVDRGVIYKIDPQRNEVAKHVAVDMIGTTRRIGVGEGSLWVIAGANKTVLKRYSIESGVEQAAVPLASAGSDVLVAFGSVWILGAGNDELYRVDPAINQVAATTDLHARPRSLAAGEGSVWVYHGGDGTVDRIDGKAGKLLATIETHEVGRGDIGVGGGFVWVSTHAAPIIQIDPRTHAVRGTFNVHMSEYSTIRHAGGSLWISGEAVRRIKSPE